YWIDKHRELDLAQFGRRNRSLCALRHSAMAPKARLPDAATAFQDTNRALKIRKHWLHLILTGEKVIEVRGSKCAHLGRVTLMETGSLLLRARVTITESHRMTDAEIQEHHEAVSALNYSQYWAWSLADVEVLQPPIAVPSIVARGSARSCKTLRKQHRRGGKESKVELYNHLAKNLLRPFPDAAGNFLWLKRSDKAQREQDMLKPAYLAKTRAVENCEALSRMSTYLSEEGATISNAANYLGNSPTVEKLGLDFFQTLGSPSGQKFVKACAFFDKDDSSSKDAGSVDGHVDAYIDFLSSDGDTKIKKARRMVLAGARAYLCGMSFLEQAALVRHPEIWAPKVVMETQQASAREFRKKPTCKRLRQVLKDSALSLLE
ncbi:unnamed protein product, partial [Symbiodinium sp. CCMP2456]